jgi:hypothetical protein
MRWLATVIFLAIPFAARAEDATLSQLRAILVPMRANPTEPLEARGAAPEFTTVKHLLRDWIELRLAQRPTWDATYALEDQVNADLIGAKLACRIDYGPNDTPCPEMTELGYLSPIKVHLGPKTLVVQTGVGIQNCGFDESAYAYEWIDKHWRRFWQTEETNYTKAGYRPQTLTDILISSNFYKEGEHLILALGRLSWCTSNLQPVYYRVWQTKSIDAAPKLMLDETDWAFVGNLEPIQGHVGTLDDRVGPADDVLIEYTVLGSSGTTGREEVRHYRLKNDRLERVDPIALSPASFVESWLNMKWPARSGWTDPQARERLQRWQFKPGPDLPGWLHMPVHCERMPDAWQEEFAVLSEKTGSTYFLVRWCPPFHFTMLDIGDHPFPGCTEKDPEADQFRALFR